MSLDAVETLLLIEAYWKRTGVSEEEKILLYALTVPLYQRLSSSQYTVTRRPTISAPWPYVSSHWSHRTSHAQSPDRVAGVPSPRAQQPAREQADAVVGAPTCREGELATRSSRWSSELAALHTLHPEMFEAIEHIRLNHFNLGRSG